MEVPGSLKSRFIFPVWRHKTSSCNSKLVTSFELYSQVDNLLKYFGGNEFLFTPEVEQGLNIRSQIDFSTREGWRRFKAVETRVLLLVKDKFEDPKMCIRYLRYPLLTKHKGMGKMPRQFKTSAKDTIFQRNNLLPNVKYTAYAEGYELNRWWSGLRGGTDDVLTLGDKNADIKV